MLIAHFDSSGKLMTADIIDPAESSDIFAFRGQSGSVVVIDPGNSNANAIPGEIGPGLIAESKRNAVAQPFRTTTIFREDIPEPVNPIPDKTFELDDKA